MLLKFWLKILTSVMENVTEFEYKLNLPHTGRYDHNLKKPLS